MGPLAISASMAAVGWWKRLIGSDAIGDDCGYVEGGEISRREILEKIDYNRSAAEKFSPQARWRTN